MAAASFVPYFDAPSPRTAVPPSCATTGSEEPLASALRQLERVVRAAKSRSTTGPSLRLELWDAVELLENHCRASETPGNVLSDVRLVRPDLAPRIDDLRRQSHKLLSDLERLAYQADFGDARTALRLRLDGPRLLNEMRRRQSGEIALVFEAMDRDLAAAD